MREWLRAAPQRLGRAVWTRRAGSLALVVVATVLAFLAAFAISLREAVLDTDTWTEASGELLENDLIRPQIALYLVDQLYEKLDVAEGIEELLPPALETLAGPAAGALRDIALRRANEFLQRPRAQELWEQANRVAHQQLVAAIEGESSALAVEDDELVVLNLRPLVAEIGTSIGLPDRLVARLDERAGELVILRLNQLQSARDTANALRIGAFAFLAGAVVCWAVAVLVAQGRRRETIRSGAVGLLAVGLLLAIARRVVGDDSSSRAPPAKTRRW